MHSSHKTLGLISSVGKRRKGKGREHSGVERRKKGKMGVRVGPYLRSR